MAWILQTPLNDDRFYLEYIETFLMRYTGEMQDLMLLSMSEVRPVVLQTLKAALDLAFLLYWSYFGH